MIDVCINELACALRVGKDMPFKEGVGVDSWRGDYSELAIGDYGKPQAYSAHELADVLKAAIGKTFEGYKGGDFVMNGCTGVHLSDYDSSSPSRFTPWLLPILVDAYIALLCDSPDPESKTQ